MRYILAGTLFTVAAFFAFSTASRAQVTCQRIGNQTYCSDGSSANQIGNFTYINPAPAPAPVYQPPVYQAPQPMYPTPLPSPFGRSR